MKKNIIITGCSSGIGFYCAQKLHQQGHQVFACARKMADVKRLQQMGLNSLPLDLDDSQSIHQAVDHIMQQVDHIDVLFNNGAYGQPGATEDLKRSVIIEQFQTNVFGTMELTNRVIAIMRQQGYGRIIHNSSVLGFVALPFRGAYNASKYALEGFADTQRLELKGSQIYISLIEPGPITSRFRHNAYQKFKQNIDRENSFFKHRYAKMEQHFSKEGPAVPFTLGEDAVYQKLHHAIFSKHPRARYFVTFPTWLFAILKRLLPVGWMDWVLLKAN